MTTKKAEADQPLALLPTVALNGSSRSLAAFQPINQEERRLLDLARVHRLVIDAQAEKTLVGLNKLNDVHARKTELFVQTTQVYEQVLRGAQGSALELYVAEYVKQDAYALTAQGDALVQVCAASIATQIAAPLQLAPEPEPRPGLWKRLTGGAS